LLRSARTYAGRETAEGSRRSLGEFPHVVARIECERCGRAGSYRREDLLVRFGADIDLPDLLMELAQCERRIPSPNAVQADVGASP
jgi:hypothetical protein